MTTYRLQTIVERTIDKQLGWVEVLACGHIHRMTANDRRSFKTLGKIPHSHTSRRCRDCAASENDQ
jgi:hypothetical protein